MRRQMPCDSCARAGIVKPAQYRCPACARCSCSLICVNAHKTHYNCTGVRDKCVPLPTREYNEHKLITDYSVLEQAKRDMDRANRHRLRHKRAQSLATNKPFDPIPRHKQRVMGEAAAKRAIDLRFMPPHFFRHQNNTSHVKPRDDGAEHQHGPTRHPFENCMVWRVDVHFCGPSGGTRLVQLHQLNEELNMAHVLERAIHNLEMRKEPRPNGDVDQYLLYARMSPSALNAYLRNDTDLGRRRAQPSILPNVPSFKRRKLQDASAHPTSMQFDTRGFIPVDTTKSLRESLHGAMVVEYPILFVAPKGSADDAHLESATKSVSSQPEQELHHALPSPHFLSTDGQANESQCDRIPTDARITDDNEYESQNAPPAQRTLSLSNHHVEKQVHHVKPPADATIPPPESPGRGQKRKADESGDSESELSELEKNIVKRLTPGRMNGGKSGYTCEGKLRVAEPRKRPPVPFSMPKFRSVLPPVGYDDDRGDTKNKKDVDVGPKDVEGDDTRAADSAESESDTERDSEEEEDCDVRKSVAGEDSEDVNDLENDQSAEEEHESDSDENESESEKESEGSSEGELEEEEGEAGDDDEQIEAEDGRVTAARKRGRDSAAQDRPRPLKRQRFEDLEAVELKGEELVAGGEEEQAKGNKRTEADEISEDGATEKKKRRMPTVSSPPPPFLKVDSVLLETRIPRRKKIPDPNGREPLIC